MKSLEEQEANKTLINKNDVDTSQEFIRYLNFKNAKLLAVLLVVLFTVYHGYLNSFYGRNSCNRLLGEGHLLGNNEWQPFGCMIHNYKENDVQTCFKYIKFYNGKNKFYFIGDFRIRQIYNSFIKHFDGSYVPQDSDDIISNKNSTYENKDLNVEVKFIWKPFIDNSLYSLLESQVGYQRPSFIVMGMAANYMMMNVSRKESIEWFKANLTNLIDMIDVDNFSRNKAITVPRKLNLERTTDSSDKRKLRIYFQKGLIDSDTQYFYSINIEFFWIWTHVLLITLKMLKKTHRILIKCVVITLWYFIGNYANR